MVGIKDLQMPSCCGECQMASCKGLSGQFYCDITTYDIDMDDTRRDANCPLVEIGTCDDCVSRKELMDNYNGVETPVGYRKVVDMEVIKNLSPVLPVQKWIPVSERLPKEEGKYLTSIVWRNNDITYTVEVALALFDGVSFKAEVVAWMPLPKPYEGDKKNE